MRITRGLRVRPKGGPLFVFNLIFTNVVRDRRFVFAIMYDERTVGAPVLNKHCLR